MPRDLRIEFNEPLSNRECAVDSEHEVFLSAVETAPAVRPRAQPVSRLRAQRAPAAYAAGCGLDAGEHGGKMSSRSETQAAQRRRSARRAACPHLRVRRLTSSELALAKVNCSSSKTLRRASELALAKVKCSPSKTLALLPPELIQPNSCRLIDRPRIRPTQNPFTRAPTLPFPASHFPLPLPISPSRFPFPISPLPFPPSHFPPPTSHSHYPLLQKIVTPVFAPHCVAFASLFFANPPDTALTRVERLLRVFQTKRLSRPGPAALAVRRLRRGMVPGGTSRFAE